MNRTEEEGQSKSEVSNQRNQGARDVKTRHFEKGVSKKIEQWTESIPFEVCMWSAYASIGASAVLQLLGRKHSSLFVGQWVPALLMFGMYKKIMDATGKGQMENNNVIVH